MLTEAVAVGARTAPSRVLLGPHVTNLGDGRALSAAHVAYYRARAAGGVGVIVTEVASVHDSDHPYERAPLAAACAPGWSAIARACRPHGTLVVAGLGHAGAEGSSAHHRRPLWGASTVRAPAVGEVPTVVWDRDALVDGFASAASVAVAAGCDGVEIQAGAHALLRQELSPLTGAGSSDLLLAVVGAVRGVVGDAVLGVRPAVDEGVSWGGITPDDGVATAALLAAHVDYLVPVRASSFVSARPDAHTPPAFLADVTRRVRAAVDGRCAVVLAGSVVDTDDARTAVTDGVADLVEMTRAQIADPDLVVSLRSGRAPRPCVLTNQECRVRDVRNPLITCTVEPGPGAGDVTSLPHRREHAERGRNATSSPRAPTGPDPVLVIGGGPAGMEAARTLALGGRPVRLVERADHLGGLLPVVAGLPGRHRFARLVAWWEAELRALGVGVELGVDPGVDPGELPDGPVLVATGAGPSAVLGALADPPPGPVVIDDPLGDGAAVALAERLAGLGRVVSLITPDPVAGKQLARTGDLVDANARLQRLGVERVLEARVVEVGDEAVTVADVDTGEHRVLPCASFVDARPRPVPTVARRPGLEVAGDAVAPRTVGEAVREGRAAAGRLIGALR